MPLTHTLSIKKQITKTVENYFNNKLNEIINMCKQNVIRF